jgi:hypothetical protein
VAMKITASSVEMACGLVVSEKTLASIFMVTYTLMIDSLISSEMLVPMCQNTSRLSQKTDNL